MVAASYSAIVEVSSRLLRVKIKIEQKSWVFISAYGSGSEKSDEEIESFWDQLNESVRNFGRHESVEVFWDLNAKVRNDVIEGINVQYGVPGRNKSRK